MGNERLTAYSMRHRSLIGLVALLLTSGAVALVLDRPKGALEVWLALPLFAAGAALFAWVLWPARPPMTTKGANLAARLIRVLTLHDRLTKAFPVAGVAIIVLDLSYNFFVSSTPSLLTEDVILLLLGATFLGYGLVPPDYTQERDFVLVFFLLLNLILVLPLLATRILLGDFDASVDAYSRVALAPETGAFLSLFGVPNVVHSLPGVTAPALTFTPPQVGAPVTLVITTACSGIYSFGIFTSAFLAFVLTEHSESSRRLWAFLGLGLLSAYIANLLRMVVIVLVGYYTDTAATDLQNMLIAHSYGGWIIFMGWTALFWGLLFRFMPLARTSAPEPSSRPQPAGRKVLCMICSKSLSPAMPAIRCMCGVFFHTTCLQSQGSCPVCARQLAATLNSNPAKGLDGY